MGPEVSLRVVLQEPLILFLRQESRVGRAGSIELCITYIKLAS